MHLTLVLRPYGHFYPFQFSFFGHFACVNANCINLGTVVYFYIAPSFSLINICCIRYKHSSSQGLNDKNVFFFFKSQDHLTIKWCSLNILSFCWQGLNITLKKLQGDIVFYWRLSVAEKHIYSLYLVIKLTGFESWSVFLFKSNKAQNLSIMNGVKRREISPNMYRLLSFQARYGFF